MKAFVGLFTSIAGPDLQGIVVRDLVSDPKDTPNTLNPVALLMLFSGFVSYLLFFANTDYQRPDDALVRSIVVILSAVQIFKSNEITVYWFDSGCSPNTSFG